jgi:glyoxylase-like metal-dependent hydrolase (beta-lactamase superfamily II)
MKRRDLMKLAAATLIPVLPRAASAATLQYKVFTATRPGLNRDIPPGKESLQWVANSSTLIYGERDAVLVDTFLTIEQSKKLADDIAATGKTLKAIYATHAHADHFFGLKILLERFPDAQALATPAVVARMRQAITPAVLDARWRKLFPNQISDGLVVAQPLQGGRIELEGNTLQVVEVGHTDTDDTTVLHVPSIGLVLAGDAVYNGIHPFMNESTRANRLEWLAALDKIDALKPRFVVAGHRLPDNNDDPRCVAETRRYLQDFIRLNDATKTVRELYDRMLEIYPDRANPGSLWNAATTAKGQA